MPIITVFPDVERAYNRVEVDWADTPEVVWARVLRVDVISGTCTPLRPYVCYLGDYLTVSCDGHAIFWDTEVPLDRQVYYITEGLDENLTQPCLPQAPSVVDTYTRIVANGWGTPDIGPATTTSGGAAGDYSTTGLFGRHTLNTANVARRTNYPVSLINPDVTISVYPQALATVAPYEMGITARRDNAANSDYSGNVVFDTVGNWGLVITRTVAGVDTVLASSGTVSNYILTEPINLHLSLSGPNITFTATSNSGLTTRTLTAFDTTLTAAGSVAPRSIRQVGNTNAALPADFDNLTVNGVCLTCTPITADTSATPTTMASNGAFRLKDPVRPCNDIYVPLCFTQVASPSCLPTSGVFFAQMDTESYDANSLILNPTNASRPIAVTRARRDKASLLQLVTRTFADRDNLLRINAAGSPLLWQGPPDYGIPDAYLSIGDISIARGLSDHRYPVRINNLPFVTVDRPAGPSLGVCGSRVVDTCDIYSTWGALATAGLLYEDLVRGRGSDDSPVGPDIRTWDEVLVEFADWNAVNTGGRTWAELEAGD